METINGFYKLENDELLYAVDVFGPTFNLFSQEYQNYTYPVEGWYWFDSEQEAKTFFNIVEEKQGVING